MSREETLDVLFHRIAVARGHEPGDLLLKNGCIVNVFSGIVEEKDIIICGDRIAGVGRYDTAKTTVDLHGAFVLPGLIDGHVHVESSFLIPQCFGRAVLSRGTTAV
ncbi:MAG: adenine deaminase, partial [Bacillota bacterium]|nr:adenine deaminase [Bacillota bacterium]